VMVPDSSPVSWSVPVDTIAYMSNGTTQGVAGTLASIDMYHTGIQVTNAVARDIYSGVQGARAISETSWSLPCNSTFPITLTFGGIPFTISERDTIIQQSYGTCTGVVTGGATPEIGKVGAPFLRNVYTQFAAAKSPGGSIAFTVGFATKNLRQIPSHTTSSSPKTTIRPNPSSTSTNSRAQTRMTVHLLPTLGVVVVSVAVLTFL
jgi:hypothetical protein